MSTQQLEVDREAPVPTDDLPESYTELREELEWYADHLNDRNKSSFVDIGRGLAWPEGTDDDPGIEELYEQFEENEETIKENVGEDGHAVAVRALQLCAALEDRVVETKTLRRYKNGRPGDTGTFYDIGRVTADVWITVYRLTENSVAVWYRKQTYHGMFAFGSGRFNVHFPRDYEEWIDSEFEEYLTPEEAKEIKEESETDE